MTDVSGAVRQDDTAPAGEAADHAGPSGPPQPAPRRGRGTAVLAGLAALVAVVCAALLPFAPVSVSEPMVSWPIDPTHPESTLLSLTAYRPLTLDVRFSCDAVRAAEAGGGVVLSTAAPESPVAGTTGMIVTVRDGRVRVGAFDRLLLDDPLPAGPCEYRLAGDSRGLPAFVRDDPDPADPDAPDLSSFAHRDNAELTISRDGTELVRTPAEELPDVDVLATDATVLPSGGLTVSMRADDEFTSSPTAVKSALIWTLIAALLVTAVLLLRLDRMTPRVPRVWRLGWPRIVDFLVPAVIVFWMFVAPATDDDGYYAAMARNSVLSGDVGNYFQLYDQNFTPFTWFYQSLGWWQQFAGNAPVMQRIPAAVFGILTWFALRRFVIAAMNDWAPHRRGVRMIAHAVLAVTFLSWWVPQDMGVRPETVVALCGAATMLAVLAASRRRRLWFAWLAFALAGLGFATHPTGFTLLAPLIAGLPLLWPVVRVAGDRIGTALRVLAVAAGGMVAPLLAFADGGLRDFIRGQTIFLSLQGQENWTTEIQRYTFLFSQIAMGNYAKRAAVLVCIVALAWFAVLAVAARARRVTVPTPLWLSASTTALAFAALWLTPSKWTHHFGALAGVGSVFLALFLVMAVPLTRRVLQGARLSIGVMVAAAATFVVTITLAWHGPNQWAYAWLEGAHRPELPPAVKNISFDRPLLWASVMIVAALIGGLAARLLGRGDVRLGVLRAVPAVVLISLFGTTVYTVGTFGEAAVMGVPRESIWAQGLADPAGEHCGAAGAVRVLDPSTASTLPVAAGLPAPPPPNGFESGGGFYIGDPPQGPAGAEIWGSLLFRNGHGAERNFGDMTTSWYSLPSGLEGGAATTVLAAGRLEEGNSLTAVYGRSSGAEVTRVGEQELTDTATESSWRTFVLAPPPEADVVRLEAVDATGMVNGFVAFSAPAVQQPTVLSDYLPADAPVALAWPLAFAYPCQRQPAMVDGITEAPEYAVLWGDGGALSGFADGTWVPSRGGAFAQVPRTQGVQQLAVVGGADPHIQVYAFSTPLARSAYTVTETTRTVSGASTATGTGPAPQG
ncbi:arabinosyltransferase domain-containing protein [Pseudonocardia yunnanensis]|uniref:Arabinosyltransferase domain-containing protein n=1 Tax=Pseudonocardia yunnanensis TaxID=58107 RepID=A0ABW4ET02_9PSEU